MGRKKLLENRADVILQAASALFAEYSYEKTTLDEIALQSRIGKGSIYLEFGSKEDILFALIEQNKALQLADMRQMAAQTSENTLVTLKAMLVKHIGMIYDFVKRNRRSPEEMMQSRERLRARLKPFFEARIHVVEELLRRAAEQNEIRPQTDFHRTAQVVMMTLRAVFPPYDPTTNKLKLQNDAAEILELIFEGLR